jgi:hypothetical protein
MVVRIARWKCAARSNVDYRRDVRLHLVDINEDLAETWREAFMEFPNVTIQQANLLAAVEHCVVSPANSYGFMDGGIDAAFCAFFGGEIEQKVRDAIARRPEGMLRETSVQSC